jgi:hypothetical protein
MPMIVLSSHASAIEPSMVHECHLKVCLDFRVLRRAFVSLKLHENYSDTSDRPDRRRECRLLTRG